MKMKTALLGLLLLLPKPVRAQTETMLRGQGGWVGAVAFAPSGKLLVSGGADRQVRIWDIEKGAILHTLTGHSNAVVALACSPTGDALASGSFDHTIKIWQLPSGNALHTLRGHDGTVMSVAFTPDGRLLSGSIDGTVRLWDAATGKGLGIVTRHRSWVNAVVVAKDGTLATGSSDNMVRLFAPKGDGWTLRATHEFRAGEVRSLAFSPDGKHLAVGVRYGELHILDAVRNKRVAELRGHSADVWAVAFSPDGKLLASGDGDWDRPGEVFLWDTASWKKAAALNASGEVLCLAFSPDSTRLTAGAWDKSLRLWGLK